MNFRVGIGYDIHKLVDGRKLILGGVEIPFEKGLLGHSDADALLHAITDAILGACALGDIGKHFPDTDPNYKNADSKLLLKKVCEIVGTLGFKVVNVDSNIIAEKPKMAPYISEMTRTIAKILGVEENCVSVKARSNEGQDSIGRQDAISTQAIVMIKIGE